MDGWADYFGTGIKVDMSVMGKCEEYSKVVNEEKGYRIARGYYDCPIANVSRGHFWNVDHDGNIVDATKNQFPSKGNGCYREVTGETIVNCSGSCGLSIKLKDASLNNSCNIGNDLYCSNCYAYQIGFDVEKEELEGWFKNEND